MSTWRRLLRRERRLGFWVEVYKLYGKDRADFAVRGITWVRVLEFTGVNTGERYMLSALHDTAIRGADLDLIEYAIQKLIRRMS